MKKLILAFTVVLLTGCGVTGLINSSDFDNTEYEGFVTVLTLAEHAKEFCGGDKGQVLRRVYLMDGQADLLENYTEHRINNEDTHEIATIIQETVDEMVDRYNSGNPVSKAYCGIKLDNIIDQAKIGAEAVQKKVRR